MRTLILLVLALQLVACSAVGSESVDAAVTLADAAPDATPPVVCTGLSLHDCRLRDGCAADICFDCSCGGEFKGCRRTDETPASCPTLDCPDPRCCGGGSDCGGGELCVRPGESLGGCGACIPGKGGCVSDGECGTAMICEPIKCSCSGARACVSGCQTTGCPEGQTCGSAPDRCAPSTCDALHPCPDDFACTDGGCVRKTCTADAACGGFCVDGECYDARGTCQIPPP